MKKLYLIDGSALIYRSYYAFIKNPLINSKGFNTNAIFGSINIFMNLHEKFSFENVAISFDLKEKTFRHDLFEEYKANRPKTPEEIISQIPIVKEFFSLMEIPDFSTIGYESDDVLASIANLLKEKYEQIIFITSDKDFCQLLISEKFVIYDPLKKEFFDQEKVKEKYNIESSQFVDYLSIVGDSSDNIPGIKGVGPKGAESLLNEYGNLKNIYENLENISKKSLKEKLIANKENAFLSLKLATIEKNVPLNIEKINSFKEENFLKTKELLQKYELNSLLNKINKKYANKEEKTEKTIHNIYVIEKDEELADLGLFFSKKEKLYLFDLEDKEKNIIGLGIGDGEIIFYLPFGHLEIKNLKQNLVMKTLEKIIAEKEIILYDIKKYYRLFQDYNLKENKVFDFKIIAYLLNNFSDKENLFSLSEKENLLIEKEIIDNFEKPNKLKTYFSQINEISKFLEKTYKNKIKALDLEKIYYQIELPLSKVLYKMEKEGVFVDKQFLQNLSENISVKLTELEEKIYAIAEEKFNLNSPSQLAEILFNKLSLPNQKKTKTGYSTDSEVLETLAQNYIIAKYLLEYRKLSKLNNTYLLALPKLINEKTKRIHTTFNQTIVSTGRLSSSNPNLQNIPIKTEEGRKIREAFIAQNEDNCLLSADYSQIELRLLANFSQDEKMIKAFLNEEDIHKETAKLIFDKKEVRSEERRMAKTINFGIIYGMGAKKLAQELGISQIDAKNFIENYFNKFPSLKNYMENQISFAKENNYVQTIFGRKLFLNKLNSQNVRLQKEAERIAINMPLQGSAADIIKIAMINIYEKIKNKDDIKMILQVHDELVFELEKEKVEEYKKLIKEEMENILDKKYQIKLKINFAQGKYWDH